MAELKNRELTSFYDLINDIAAYLNEYHRKRRSDSAWLRYLRCDGSPDPSIPKEINTFLTLWREDYVHNRVSDSLINIDSVIKVNEIFILFFVVYSQCFNKQVHFSNFLKLIDEIEFMMEDLSEDNDDHKLLFERYQQV